jgi:multiple sugar transport system substrate-binding protein
MQAPKGHYFFQIALLVIFSALGLGGVFVLSTYDSEGDVIIKAPVTIWGPPIGSDAFTKVLLQMKDENESFEKVTYIEKNPLTMYSDLLEAVATGESPDLVVMDSSNLLSLRNKIYPISFETLPVAVFRDTYIEGSEIYVLDDLIYAFPIFVDPLVMYWNRDLFANAAIAQVPKDWDTFVDVTPRLSKIIQSSDLIQSAVAFGEYDNVLHAKEILSTLFMQTGANIVQTSYNQTKDATKFISDLVTEGQNSSTELALIFYTSFSNPIKTVYSWNKTFERSREAFAANKVAMYAGFVGEEKILTEINPNLNFGMSLWPQSNNTHDSVTYGKFYGVAVMRASENPDVALYAAQLLSSAQYAPMFSELTGLPSARKDALSAYNVDDPYGTVKVQSAIIAKSWLEPAPQSAVNDTFKSAIDGVVSGTISPTKGVYQITSDLDALLKRYN